MPVGSRLAPIKVEGKSKLLELALARWRLEEPDKNLTWGSIVPGDSFVDAMLKYIELKPDMHICEIGPGYGRLLKTLLDRSLPFREYTGVELSPYRTAKLTAEYGSDKVRFLTADVATVRLSEPCDLFFSALTFNRLFPDFTPALRNLLTHSATPRARIAIDLPLLDDDFNLEHVSFEAAAFNRVYSACEVEAIFKSLDRDVTFERIEVTVNNEGQIRRRVLVIS